MGDRTHSLVTLYAGNLLQIAYPNGTSISYSYDAGDRLLSVNNLSGNETLSSYLYSLDPLGNRIQMIEDDKFKTSYAYDSLSQLIAVTNHAGLKTRYTYDGVGNILSVAGQGKPVKFSYDASNRLLRAGKRAFSYDVR